MTIAPTAVLTRLPRVLTGSAGGALEAMGTVRGEVSMFRSVFKGVLDGTESAAGAHEWLTLPDSLLGSNHLRGVVNGAKPGLERVLGSAQPNLSASLHANLAQIRSGTAILGTTGVDDARAMAAATSGLSASSSAMQSLDDVIPQLQRAARATAAQRVAVGAIGVGATAAGIRALLHAGDDVNEMAPGPIGESPAGSDRVA